MFYIVRRRVPTVPTKPIEELEAMVGTTHENVVEFRVEAGKVEEFARAVGDDNPAHRDEEAATRQGFDGVPAPLTFTRTAYFPRYRPEGVDAFRPFELGFRPEYSLHGEQAYEFERPLVVGDVLHGAVTLTDVYQKGGGRGGQMTFAEFEIEYYDEDDELVVTERQTVIETGGAVGEGEG